MKRVNELRVFNAPSLDGEYAFFYHRKDDHTEVDDPEKLAALIERARSTGHPFHDFSSVETIGEMIHIDAERQVARISGNIGLLLIARGEYQRALAQLTEALETHRRFRIAPSIFHVTTNISRLLLQLCRETDEEPSWLGELLPALREMNGTPGTWKQRVLSQTRHHIEEGAEGNAEAARERLQRLLDDEEDREVVAESWYWIWKLRVGKEERAREEAERLYTELFADRPMKRYR